MSNLRELCLTGNLISSLLPLQGLALLEVLQVGGTVHMRVCMRVYTCLGG